MSASTMMRTRSLNRTFGSQPRAFFDLLIGDASKAKKVLGWEPKVRFKDLVRIMVDADMELLSRETPRKHLGKLPWDAAEKVPVRLGPAATGLTNHAQSVIRFRHLAGG